METILIAGALATGLLYGAGLCLIVVARRERRAIRAQMARADRMLAAAKVSQAGHIAGSYANDLLAAINAAEAVALCMEIHHREGARAYCFRDGSRLVVSGSRMWPVPRED